MDRGRERLALLRGHLLHNRRPYLLVPVVGGTFSHRPVTPPEIVVPGGECFGDGDRDGQRGVLDDLSAHPRSAKRE